MIIKRIEIDGFGPHKKTALDLNEPMIAFIGQNGAGKTFALEAVPAVLFGLFPSRGGSILDHITQGHVGDCLLAAEFMIGDKHYRAERKARKKLGGSASQECYLFYKNGQPGWSAMAGPKQEDFNKHIAQLIGDEKLFLSSVFSSQNMAGDIIDAKPTERKRLLGELLGLGKYEELARSALSKQNALVFALEEFAKRRALLSEQLEGDESLFLEMETRAMAEKGAFESEIVAIESEIMQSKTKMAELESQKAQLEEIAKKRQALIEQGKEINTAMQSNIARQAQFKTLIERIPDLEKRNTERQLALEKQTAQTHALHANQETSNQIRDLESQLGQEQLTIRTLEMKRDGLISEAQSKKKANVEATSAKVRELQNALANLARDAQILERGDFSFEQCKACLFTKKAFESKSSMPELTNQLSNAQSEWQRLQEKVIEAPPECAEIDATILAKGQIIRDLTIRVGDLKGKLLKIETILLPADPSQELANARAAQSNIQEWDAIIGQQKEKIESIRAEIVDLPPANLEELVSAIRQFQSKIEPATLRINQRRLDIAKLDSSIGGIAAKREKNAKIKSSIAELEAKNATDIHDLQVFDYLGKALGRNGIQALLIDSAIPSLQAISDDLLQIATEGRMQISLSTQKELKDGRTSESLEIRCSDENGIRDVQNFSGGEQKILRTILRMSLAIFQSQRSDIRIKTLFIDELFDALDQSNAHALLRTLTRVSEYFERVIFISHDDGLLADFDNKIEIKKGKPN